MGGDRADRFVWFVLRTRFALILDGMRTVATDLNSGKLRRVCLRNAGNVRVLLASLPTSALI